MIRSSKLNQPSIHSCLGSPSLVLWVFAVLCFKPAEALKLRFSGKECVSQEVEHRSYVTGRSSAKLCCDETFIMQ